MGDTGGKAAVGGYLLNFDSEDDAHRTAAAYRAGDAAIWRELQVPARMVEEARQGRTAYEMRVAVDESGDKPKVMLLWAKELTLWLAAQWGGFERVWVTRREGHAVYGKIGYFTSEWDANAATNKWADEFRAGVIPKEVAEEWETPR